MSSYKERRQKSQAEKDELQLQYEAEDAQAQLKADITATSREITRKQREVEELRSAADYNPTAIIAAQQELKQYQEGLAALQKLEAEDFPS